MSWKKTLKKGIPNIPNESESNEAGYRDTYTPEEMEERDAANFRESLQDFPLEHEVEEKDTPRKKRQRVLTDKEWEAGEGREARIGRKSTIGE